jgi:hypothetical protein
LELCAVNDDELWATAGTIAELYGASYDSHLARCLSGVSAGLDAGIVLFWIDMTMRVIVLSAGRLKGERAH